MWPRLHIRQAIFNYSFAVLPLNPHRETEQLVFQTAGLIETADGRTINFGSSLRMSRDYYEESSLINQFIDEADSIYSRLRIWLMNEDGSRQLVGLGEKGVGAIYLGHVTSPFQLKDQQNRSLGGS